MERHIAKLVDVDTQLVGNLRGAHRTGVLGVLLASAPRHPLPLLLVDIAVKGQ